MNLKYARRELEDWPGYSINILGQVFGKTGKKLVARGGVVTLNRDGKSHRVYTSSLILEVLGSQAQSPENQQQALQAALDQARQELAEICKLADLREKQRNALGVKLLALKASLRRKNEDFDD